MPVVLERARSGKLPWTRLTEDEWRALARGTIDRIEVTKGQRGKPFSSDRVNIVAAA